MESIKDMVGFFLEKIGEDPNREGLIKTPERVENMWEFLTKGYKQNPDEIINGAIFDEDYDEMVLVRDIYFFSMCEHHMLPFFGVCHVGYIPNGKVIGLSKIPRIVDMYARRLQLQERMTTQIANCIKEQVNPRGVGVITEGYHLCMMMRGVEKQNAKTVTSAMLGNFRKSERTRMEFLNLTTSQFKIY